MILAVVGVALVARLLRHIARQVVEVARCGEAVVRRTDGRVDAKDIAGGVGNIEVAIAEGVVSEGLLPLLLYIPSAMKRLMKRMHWGQWIFMV